MNLKLNGVDHAIEVDPETPLLWVVRDHLGMTGTKFGCGMGLCGACTMLVGGVATRTCVLPVGTVGDAEVRTIEGIGEHPVKDAWIAEQVPQCGYCQSGQIVAAVGFLAEHPDPTEEEVRAGLTNLCRCGTYDRIRKAVLRAAKPPTARTP